MPALRPGAAGAEESPEEAGEPCLLGEFIRNDHKREGLTVTDDVFLRQIAAVLAESTGCTEPSAIALNAATA